MKGHIVTSKCLSMNVLQSSRFSVPYRMTTLEGYLYSTNGLATAFTTHNGRRKFCSTHNLRATPKKSRLKDAIPFESSIRETDFHPQIPADTPEIESLESNIRANFARGRQSTITASERVVFERIFKDISRSELAQQQEDDLETELPEDGDKAQSVEEVFEGAISSLEEKENGVKFDHVKYLFHPQATFEDHSSPSQQHEKQVEVPCMTSAEYPEAQSFKSEPSQASDVYEAARQEHKDRVMIMLGKAQSDVQVWKILESEIFGLINALDLGSETTNTLALEKEGKPKRTASQRNKDTAASSNPLTEPTNSSHSRQLSILQYKYGTYCLEALRLLRRKFPTSPYAIQVLPAIKRQGSISYVLGTSTNLYNEVIFLKWAYYTDLHSIADLLQEMCNQGVEANEVTLELLKAISRERRIGLIAAKNDVITPAVSRHTNPELIGTWWTMRAVQEAWSRILPNFSKFQQEHSQRLLRMNGQGDKGGYIVEGQEGEEQLRLDTNWLQNETEANHISGSRKTTSGVTVDNPGA